MTAYTTVWSHPAAFRGPGARLALRPRPLVIGQHRQVLDPRAHGLAVLLGHHPADLGEVAEVVGHPGGEELAQGDGTETGVGGGEVEVGSGQVPGGESLEVGGAQSGELSQQILESTTGVARLVAEAIVGLEAGLASPCQQQPRPRYPVGLLAIDQVYPPRRTG